MKNILTHVGMLIFGIMFGFMLGFISFDKKEIAQPQNELTQIMQEANKLATNSGAKVTITRTTSDGKSEEVSSSSTSKGESDNKFWRIFGHDRGANDTASGLAPNKFNGTEIGGSRNYGVLERIWNWIVNWIWTISVISVFFFLALGVMFFIPATSAIASTIFTWIASVVPVIGTAIASMFAKIKLTTQKTATSQIVLGIQDFKDTIDIEPFVAASDLILAEGEVKETKANMLTLRIRDRIKTLFKLACNDSQKDVAKDVVATILNEK